MRKVLILSLILGLSLAQDLPRPELRELGSIRLQHAAFIEAFEVTGGSGQGKYTLYITTFDAGRNIKVYKRDLG